MCLPFRGSRGRAASEEGRGVSDQVSFGCGHVHPFVAPTGTRTSVEGPGETVRGKIYGRPAGAGNLCQNQKPTFVRCKETSPGEAGVVSTALVALFVPCSRASRALAVLPACVYSERRNRRRLRGPSGGTGEGAPLGSAWWCYKEGGRSGTWVI